MADLIEYANIADVVWTRLAHAANDLSQPLRLLAVATVSNESLPSNRLMVLRGADRDSACIWFHTDRRSSKIRHLKYRPHVSALAYDHRDGVQIRLDGTVTLHDADSLADDHWHQTSMALRFAYGMAASPGQPLAQPDPRLHTMRQQHDRGLLDEGRRNFMVMQVQVQTIDWYQATSDGQRRARLQDSANWSPEPFVP